MRLLLNLKSQEKRLDYNEINQFDLQSLVYSLLKNTKYDFLHDKEGFKYFSYGNIFPYSPHIYKGDNKKFIISSPNKKFILNIYHRLKTLDYVKIAGNKFRVGDILKFNDKIHDEEYRTTSPIVLHDNEYDDEGNLITQSYFSFKKNKDISFFLQRLKDNALKKFNSYYDDEYYFEEEILESFNLEKEVAIPFTKKENDFLMIGSVHNNIQFNLQDADNTSRKFFKFLYDCGLGEKNSAGFGMINKVNV